MNRLKTVSIMRLFCFANCLQYIFKYFSLHLFRLYHSIISFTAAQLFFSR